MHFLVGTAVAALGVALFLRHPQFGQLPRGTRLRRIQDSPNFVRGAFRNLESTSVMAADTHWFELLRYALFAPTTRTRPKTTIPSNAVSLHHLDRSRDLAVWFGHSSYFLQISGLRVLVDPIFNGTVSPLGFTNKSFAGSDIVGVNDIPDLDVLVLTHDHWDHLEYSTVKSLIPRCKRVVTSLGVGQHLERWGCPPEKLIELDWWESVTLGEGLRFTAVPGRHFSGRLLRRAQTLWSGFVVQSETRRILIGGDGGYGAHFATIGEKFGPFDLAFLECGQYDNHWRSIHMLPEQSVQAAIDLKAKVFMPVHWSKFVLAKHAWDDPIRRVVNAAKERGQTLVHPRIGEVLDFDNLVSEQWWHFEDQTSTVVSGTH